MKISVCMATYNGSLYIEEQIISILKQLHVSDELIISDDYSKDETVSIIKEIKDPRIKLIFNQGEKGYTRNFENALSESSGDIIFLADQDDVWVDNKVEMMLNQLETSDFVVSDARIVDDKLDTIHDSHFKIHQVKKGFWNNWTKTRYIGACMAFKRSVLEKALPFPKNQRYCAHDYWLTILSEAYFNVSLVNTPLLLYRRHGNNASSGGDSSKNSIWLKIYIRIYGIFNVFIRYLK